MVEEVEVTYGEAGAGGPDAVALAVEDGGFVDIAGADEAGGGEASQYLVSCCDRAVQLEGRRWWLPLVNIGCSVMC